MVPFSNLRHLLRSWLFILQTELYFSFCIGLRQSSSRWPKAPQLQTFHISFVRIFCKTKRFLLSHFPIRITFLFWCLSNNSKESRLRTLNIATLSFVIFKIPYTSFKTIQMSFILTEFAYCYKSIKTKCKTFQDKIKILGLTDLSINFSYMTLQLFQPVWHNQKHFHLLSFLI